MVAASNSAVVTSVPYFGPAAYLGMTADYGAMMYEPGYYSVVIPEVLLGNEWKPGFAAFSRDGVTVDRGVSTDLPQNFFGFFANITSQEGTPGSNPYTTDFSRQFQVPVVATGTIFVYNSTPISTDVQTINIVTSVTDGTTPPDILVGALIQGGTPAGATVVTITTRALILSANSTVGGGVWVRSKT